MSIVSESIRSLSGQQTTRIEKEISSNRSTAFHQIHFTLNSVTVISLLIMAASLAVICGWFFDLPLLTNIQPDFASMKFNSALCLLLSAIALFAKSEFSSDAWQRPFSLLLIGIVAVVSILTLVEYATDFNIGIDELVIRDHGANHLSYAPGRMAPTSALSTLLLAFAIASLVLNKQNQLRLTACTIAFLISYFTITAYAYDISQFQQIKPFASMALHSALCCLALSMAIIIVDPNVGFARIINSQSAAGIMLRTLLPVAVTLPLLFGWLRHFGESSRHYSVEFGVALFTVANAVVFSILIFRNAGLIQQLDNEKREIEIEKAQAESTAKKQEMEAKLIMENVVDAVITIDDQGHILSINRSGLRMFGYKKSELIGQSIKLLIPEPYKSKTDACMDRYREHGMSAFLHVGGEVMGERKDGTIFLADLAASEYCSQENKRIYVGILRDISERKGAEAELRKWEHLFTHAGWALAIARPHDRVLVSVNPTYAKMHGYEPEELVGKTIDFLVAPESQWILDGALKTSDIIGDHTYETMRIRKDGTKFPALNQVTSFRDSSGRVLFRAGTLQDLTAIKREEELQRQKEAAEIASAAKTAFLSNMSHEIRTPLGVVLGFSELLAHPNITEVQKKHYTEAIKRNGELLSCVINDILDIAKVEAGRLDIETTIVSVSDILQDIETLLNHSAKEKGIELILRSDESIPALVETDSTRLRQILVNIIGNAIKFTSSGHVHVTVKNIFEDSTEKLAFIVKDTGCGLSSEHTQRLFIPFSQADSSTTRKYGGSGLGLVLSKKLANMLGGDVVLSESTPGVGSTFTITIGAISRLEKQIMTRQNPIFEHMQTSAPNQKLADIRILLVDDAPDNRQLMGHILKAAGATIETATNGLDAICLAKSGSFDVVLMDIQMPIMDGYEAIRRLRDHGYRKPVIALTAHAMSEERERCMAAGFNSHISKPVQQNRLLEVVSQIHEQWRTSNQFQKRASQIHG